MKVLFIIGVVGVYAKSSSPIDSGNLLIVMSLFLMAVSLYHPRAAAQLHASAAGTSVWIFLQRK